MKTLLLDVKGVVKKGFSKLDCEDKLEEFYKLLDCDCIDITERKIGDKWFDIVCDDEALLKNHPILSFENSKDCYQRIYDNLLFFHHDEEGNLTELSDNDIQLIEECCYLICKEDFTLQPIIVVND